MGAEQSQRCQDQARRRLGFCGVSWWVAVSAAVSPGRFPGLVEHLHGPATMPCIAASSIALRGLAVQPSDHPFDGERDGLGHINGRWVQQPLDL